MRGAGALSNKGEIQYTGVDARCSLLEGSLGPLPQRHVTFSSGGPPLVALVSLSNKGEI